MELAVTDGVVCLTGSSVHILQFSRFPELFPQKVTAASDKLPCGGLPGVEIIGIEGLDQTAANAPASHDRN
jgi:hypothetical protein